MKISKMIEHLKNIYEEHGDLECWYAVDDEGNAFKPLHFEPTMRYLLYGEDLYSEKQMKEIISECEETDDDPPEFEKICLVN